MPQIAQQDYKVIAPKEGRIFSGDAAALVEIKKSILNGTIFDCLIKDTLVSDGDINRILGLYPDGTSISYYSQADGNIMTVELPYTVTQYQGLAAVQEALDKEISIQTNIPLLTKRMDNVHLGDDNSTTFICVDGKFLTVTGSGTIEALTIAGTGPSENFVNITWEDAQKLIGLPIKS